MARIETQDSGAAIREMAEAELEPGEKLVWFDQPRPGALARRSLPMAFVGIPFTAFAVFWLWGVTQVTGKANNAIAVFFPLWGLMFVAIGLCILCAPLWSAFKARSMAYAVTDRRVMIIERFPFRRTASYGPQELQGLERTERGGGIGDLVFRREQATAFRGSVNVRGATAIGFFGVSDVRRVEESVRRLTQGTA
jgi:hypothetical protein